MRSSRLTIEMLEGVVALVRNKTFERAGQDLGISASALHKRIDRLNEVFGIELFVSTREGMVLIQEAQGLAQESLRIVEYALLAEQRTAAAVSRNIGRVRIGHPTYIPPKLLSIVSGIVADRSSGLKIDSRGDLTLNLKQQVLVGDLDAGIGFLPVAHPDLLIYLLAEDPIVVCMPPNHRLASKAYIEPQDLEKEPIIAASRNSFPALFDEIDSFFKEFGVILDIKHDAFGPPSNQNSALQSGMR